MSFTFTATNADSRVIAELSAVMPAKVFATAEYFSARRYGGEEMWILGLRQASGALAYGCGAFVRHGRLNRTLSIPSMPPVSASNPFWDGLRTFCRDQRITSVELDTFDSDEGMEVPHLGSNCVVTPRSEYVLDITGDVMSTLSSSHRKNVRRGQRAGLALRRSRSDAAVKAQLMLMGHSMDRRRMRGERVPQVSLSDEFRFLLQAGAAELFQAVRDEAVLSSVVILRSERGAYSYYAGTSPEGMSVSASHFLNFNIAMALRAEGIERYNLGGAPERSSLASYKEAFGTQRIPLSTARAYLGPVWRRKLTSAFVLYQASPKKFGRVLIGKRTRLKVYAALTSEVPRPPERSELRLLPLTAHELRAIRSGDASFRDRQVERLERFGESFAFGVYASDQLAHISWLLPAHAMKKDHPNVIRAKPDEAEITGCETLPDFRGRGIYGYAIANLVALLRSQNVRRVYMKTLASNGASQSGIQKAGLRLVGSASIFVLPATQRTVILRRFG